MGVMAALGSGRGEQKQEQEGIHHEMAWSPHYGRYDFGGLRGAVLTMLQFLSFPPCDPLDENPLSPSPGPTSAKSAPQQRWYGLACTAATFTLSCNLDLASNRNQHPGTVSL